MARTKKNGKKNQAGNGGGKFNNKGKKKAVVKKSNFSMDRLEHPSKVMRSNSAPAAAAGSPTRYLYGNSTSSTKHTKRKQQQQKQQAKKAPSKKGKKSKKKNKYQAKLPIVDGNSKPVPWWRKEVIQQITKQQQQQRKQQQKDSKQQQPQQVKLLSGALSINESTLQHLNAELLEFGNYVRLSAVEQDARHFMIQRIQQICQQLFGIDASKVQTFGSLAAPEVCIFESDIDLAIWGVVDPDDDINGDNGNDNNDDPRRISIHRKRSISLAEDSLPGDAKEDAHDEDEEKEKERLPPPDHPNRKKQEKIQRWKMALDVGIQEVRKSLESEKKKSGDNATSERQPLDPANEEEQQTQPDQRETPDAVSDLFVLDRTGVEDANVEKAEPDTKPEKPSGGDVDDLPKADGGNDDESVQALSDSEDDDADKLETLWSRSIGGGEPRRANSLDERRQDDDDDDGDDSDDNDDNSTEPMRKRPRGQSMISLSSATTCSGDENDFDESGMEVSFMVDKTQQRAKKKAPGPTGRARTQVVNALYKITRHLRPYAATLHVRKKARVPIINLASHFGFECDIAMGGHNGTDTSSYASAQVARFKSFPVIVVVLKILLSQHGLDKPFTGGLGSFSLYVLVANHMECHLADGGNDDPAETLVTFLFRYGAVRHSNSKIASLSRTLLSQQMVIQTSDGGSTDMGCVYQVESIVGLFEVCYQALRKRLTSNMMKSHSILQYVVDAEKLDKERGRYKRQASNKLSQLGGSKIFNRSSSFANIRAPQMSDRTKFGADAEAEKLIKSYNQDVDAFMPSERPSKKFKSTRDATFARNESAPLEEPSRAKKTKQGGGKKKGKNKSKRRRTI